MKYLFEEETLNPVELEKRLGLKRDEVKSITIYPGGAVEVETTADLDSTKQQKLKDILKLRNLPRGKKPKE